MHELRGIDPPIGNRSPVCNKRNHFESRGENVQAIGVQMSLPSTGEWVDGKGAFVRFLKAEVEQLTGLLRLRWCLCSIERREAKQQNSTNYQPDKLLPECHGVFSIVDLPSVKSAMR